jgi:CheY-like chemotaxis protein
MPSGGRIRILAANTELGRGERATLNKGRYVKISVADQGHGIPEAHLPKIFDPFFTTKERGRGLGLATSFSIVKRHGGQIHVDSEVGVGTTAHVYLPATKGKPSVEPRAEDRAIQREGKILLIDDEEIVRVSARRTLERFGYEVEVATDGTHGIQLYEAAMHGGRPFDVVILDLTIPGGMGGKEAIGRLTEIDPGAKVIVSSGYSDDPAMSRHREYGFSGVLIKPYVAEDLAEAIHQVLKGIEE